MKIFVIATPFDAIVGSLVSQGDLFRIPVVVNTLAAVLIVAAHRWWIGLVAVIAQIFAVIGAWAVAVVTRRRAPPKYL